MGPDKKRMMETFHMTDQLLTNQETRLNCGRNGFLSDQPDTVFRRVYMVWTQGGCANGTTMIRNSSNCLLSGLILYAVILLQE